MYLSCFYFGIFSAIAVAAFILRACVVAYCVLPIIVFVIFVSFCWVGLVNYRRGDIFFLDYIGFHSLSISSVFFAGSCIWGCESYPLLRREMKRPGWACMDRVLAFLRLFFEMECGVGGGKCYSNYIINVEIARYYSFCFRSCNTYVFTSIEQLTRSLVGPMECMVVSRMSNRKEGQISLIRAPEFVNKVLTCSWRRGEAGKRREEKECC